MPWKPWKPAIRFRTVKDGGRRRVIPITARRSKQRLRGAKHGVLPEYDGEKLDFRVRSAKALPKHDVVLELNAGSGTVSQAYNMPHKEHVMVDMYGPALAAASRRTSNHHGKHTVLTMNNKRFITRHVAEYQGRITLVDFDPYGCPGEEVQQFFQNYRVDRPMVVNLTDGSVTNWMNMYQRDFYRDYLTRKHLPRKDDVPDLLDNLIQNLGEKHGFKVKKLDGEWKSNRHAYYASYLANP